MELFKDIHLVKLELLSNATTIENALNYIRTKQQSQQKQKKRQDLECTSNGNDNDNDDGGQSAKETDRQTVF
jgi:hypothetical protein